MEKKQKKEYIQIIILSIAILIFALSTIFNSSISLGLKKLLYKADIKDSKDDLVVHFINVGQGDAIALKFPNEEVMVIDAGPKESQNYLVDYIKNDVLSSNNNLILNYLILTHPDIDHSGGMSALFEEFEIKTFFRPNIASVSEENYQDYMAKSTLNEYDELIKKSKQEKDLQTNVIKKEYEFYVGEAYIQIFSPLKVYDTTNEMSPVIKVTYLNKSFLFTGDIQGDSEKDMLNKYGDIFDADVLKVAHHGSKSSSSVEFIQEVSPQYAVICVGENTYGHPNFSTIANLEEVGAIVLTTSQNSVRFVCGHEMFGLLKDNTIHSYEFIDWWIIVVAVDLILAIVLTNKIIKIVKQNKKSKI